MQARAEGLQKVAVTSDAQQLPPGTAIGMVIGTQVAPADPAAIHTVWIGAEMAGGVDLAASPPRHDEARGRGGRRLWARGTVVLTGVAVRLGGEARKRCGLKMALWPWAWGLRCRRTHSGGVTRPRPLEHNAQPHQSDQHQLVEKKMGDHGKTPS